MILDSQTRFSDAQSIAAAASTVASTNYYDTGATPDIGIGQETYLVISIGTAVAGAGASVQFLLQTDDNSSFSSPTSFPLTGAIGVASLTANSVQYRGRLPIGLERYIRVAYTISGATTTAGTATAYITNDIQHAPTIATTVPGVK